MTINSMDVNPTQKPWYSISNIVDKITGKTGNLNGHVVKDLKAAEPKAAEPIAAEPKVEPKEEPTGSSLYQLYQQAKTTVSEKAAAVSAYVEGIKQSITTNDKPAVLQITHVVNPIPALTHVPTASATDKTPGEESVEVPPSNPSLKKSPSMPDFGVNDLIEKQEVKQGSMSAQINPNTGAHQIEVEEDTGGTKAEAALKETATTETQTPVEPPKSEITVQAASTIPAETTVPAAIKEEVAKPGFMQKISNLFSSTVEPKAPIPQAAPAQVTEETAKPDEKQETAVAVLPEVKPVESTMQKIMNFMPGFIKAKAPAKVAEEAPKQEVSADKKNGEQPAVNAEPTVNASEKPEAPKTMAEASAEDVSVKTPDTNQTSVPVSNEAKPEQTQKPAEELNPTFGGEAPAAPVPGNATEQPATAEAKEVVPADAPATEKTLLLTPAKIRVTPKPAPTSFFGKLWDKVKRFASWIFAGFKAVFHTVFWWTKPKATKVQRAPKPTPQINHFLDPLTQAPPSYLLPNS